MWIHRGVNARGAVVQSTYDADRLLELLVGRLKSQPVAQDQLLLVRRLVDQASSVEGVTLAAIAELAFRAGYYYRLFLEKNDVVLPDVHAGSN